ncbi:MAG TPA: DUF2795 domain-containing protein [Chloroflexota bacterium]
MVGTRKRPYDHSDLKELMDNVGGWAESWDHVLRYLRGPARYDADFAEDEVPALIADVQRLKERGLPFTTDYRNVWQAITGEDASKLPPPEGVKKPPTNPLELEDRYLKGLQFPAEKDDVLRVARQHHAPPRVMGVLERIESRTYTNMGSLLEEVGDHAWDHD